MSVTFGGATLVSDTTGANYGQYRLEKGAIQEMVFERDFPRGEGVIEVSSGNRKRVHVIDVLWFTTNETTLDSQIDALITEKRYKTLVCDGKSFGSCRLIDAAQITPGRATSHINGTPVKCYGQKLIFKQVRI
jgi:hypothetical protein